MAPPPKRPAPPGPPAEPEGTLRGLPAFGNKSRPPQPNANTIDSTQRHLEAFREEGPTDERPAMEESNSTVMQMSPFVGQLEDASESEPEATVQGSGGLTTE